MSQKSLPIIYELAFQLFFHLLVFVFYAIDWSSPAIEPFEIVFFFNYALMAFVVNYALLPRFLYPKKYGQFIIGLLVLLGISIVIEEFVLEMIYFPDTRGKIFSGFFFTLLDILPVSVALVGVKFAWDALLKQQEVEELQAAIKESELHYLKSQINPHFLFNNMNNLYAHAIEQSPKTPEIILELSSVLRYMLYDCKSEYVPLEKEVEHLEHFVNISALQIEERGKVHFSATTNQGYCIAPLILVVFVENAFKHSTASQADEIVIDISIQVDTGGKLELVCTNSFEQQSNTNDLSSGIGLENVKKRLQLLYSNAHQLDIEVKENHYKVVLSLELHQLSSI